MLNTFLAINTDRRAKDERDNKFMDNHHGSCTCTSGCKSPLTKWACNCINKPISPFRDEIGLQPHISLPLGKQIDIGDLCTLHLSNPDSLILVNKHISSHEIKHGFTNQSLNGLFDKKQLPNTSSKIKLECC